MNTSSQHHTNWTRIIALCCVLCITAPAISWAQPKMTDAEKNTMYEKHTNNASQKYGQKDYAGAIQEFKKAYSVKPVANIIYNIGRLYEKMGNFEQAVKHYEQYVNQPDIELAPRQDALARIKTLKEVLALRKKEDKKDPEKKDPKTKEPDKNTKIKIVKVKPKPKPADHTVAYVFMGAGATSLVVGGVFGILTSGAHNSFTKAQSLDDRRSAANNGQTFGYVADGLLVTGGVLAIVGLVTYALDAPEKPEEEKTTSITPNIGTDRFSVDVSFRF